MHNRFVQPLVLLLLLVCPVLADTAPDSDVPVAPIPGTEFKGWTNAFVLSNPMLEVVIVPAIGRIVSIAPTSGVNLLRMDESLAGALPAEDQAWMNVGGDWMWPVAQSRWTLMAESDWPPPAPLAEAAWEGRAWKSADGALSCLISREYGEPLHVKVSRNIKLEAEEARIVIRQKIERTETSDIPVTLWNISQVGKAAEVILPVDENSEFEKGIKALMSDLPGETQLTACDGSVVYETSIGEHKICSDSSRGWIAARKGGVAVLEKAQPENGNGAAHPDGGCTVEMYSNAGLGYSEIETLSVEKVLAPGEILQNILTIDILEIPACSHACEMATEIRKALGEVTEPPPAPPAEPE